MARRVSLPAADDLFGQPPDRAESTEAPVVRAVPDPTASEATPAPRSRRPSGRVKHDEKMTVYVTSAELLDLEQTRLSLRGEHGLAVDRGRLVREALALVLADFHERGEDSVLVRRLTED